MPGPQQIAGEDRLQLESVEAAGVCAIVRDRTTDQGLHQKQCRDHHEKLQQRLLPGAGLTGRHQFDFQLGASVDPTQIFELAEREQDDRSEEHTSELQSLMRISYAVFCLNKKKKKEENQKLNTQTITQRTITHHQQ